MGRHLGFEFVELFSLGISSRSTSESVGKAGLDGEVDEGGGSVSGELLHDVPCGPGLHHRRVVADAGDVVFVA